MHNQSNPPRPSGPQHNLQSERMPSNLMSPSQLAQFTNANANGYLPRPQMSATAYATQHVATSNTAPPQTITTTSAPEQLVIAYLKELDGRTSIQPPQAQPIDLEKFKGFKFVTLDGLVVATRDIYDKVSGTFKWEMCESQTERCVKYIQDECANKRVFFITSGSLGRDIVPKMHDLPQVYAIYVYCADLKFHLTWARSYSKVRVICNDDDRYLVPQLAVDVAQANVDWGNAHFQKGNREDAKKKYSKALENLNVDLKSTIKPDQAMINEVKNKLDQCK
ncbi:hypothetical protein I4U23_018752 [Adineta vaga]|nr:hypothetical protein I4U23_018752 [Adineta vaga]